MKNKSLKYILDTVMMILMIVLMGYQITGNFWHEVIGILLFALFLLHNIWNKKWFLHLGQILKGGRNNPVILLWNLTNILLLGTMILLAVSSIFISKSIFAKLGLSGGFLWKQIHTTCAYGGFILISIHLGCHWKIILTQFQKAFHIPSGQREFTIITRILALCLSILGVVSSFEKGIGHKLVPSFAGGNHNQEQKFYNQEIESLPEENIDQNPDSSAMTLSATETESQSLEDYLGNLFCTGCGKYCSLLSPQCETGQSQASYATQEFQAQSNSSADSTQKDSSNSTENDSQNSSEDNTQNGSSENGQNYGNRHGYGNGDRNGYGRGNENAGNDNEDSSNQEPFDSDRGHLSIEGDENLLSLFTDYIPISGLYVCGTYYTLELIYKKKKKAQKASSLSKTND